MHYLVRGDLDREQVSDFDYISLYGEKSDRINRNVRYVHYILQKKGR